MEDNKMIAGMVVIGLTLITIAYISRDVPAPTAPEEPDEYYYDNEEYMIKPQLTNGIMVLDIDDLHLKRHLRLLELGKALMIHSFGMVQHILLC